MERRLTCESIILGQLLIHVRGGKMIPTSHHSQKQIPSNFKNIKKRQQYSIFFRKLYKDMLKIAG